ncbi:AarF/ABC1/UbiB kinase family protein [bacterium]|nr:AarF/ABC1/UbiB kinase family protein [bacterium]
MAFSLRRSIDLVRLGQSAVKLRSAQDDVAAAHARQTLIERMGKLRGLPQKLGQILAMGSSAGAADFRPLTDHAPAMPLWSAQQILEESWGVKIDEVIASIEEEGLAASLGQVHRATLHDGRNVAIKVRYPGIEKAVASDLSLLGWLSLPAGNLRRGFDMTSYREEILRDIEEELDYEQEANHQRAFRLLAAELPSLIVPALVDEWSSDRVLVTTWEQGVSIEEAASWSANDRRTLARRLLLQFAHLAFDHGTLHADPHPGNYRFRLSNGEPEVVLYDFGSVLRLTDQERFGLIRLIHATAHDSDIDPYPLFLALGFDDRTLEPVRSKLPALCRVLFEPFATGVPYDLTRWNRAVRVADVLGDDRWNFRISGPARLVFLMRAFHGLVYYLERLGEPINWGWHVMPIIEKHLQAAQQLVLPEAPPSDASMAHLAKHLCILVKENGRTKASVTLPALAVDDLEAYVDEEVASKIRERGLSIPAMVQNARRRGYAPGPVFDLEDADRSFRVWLA